MHWYWKDFRQIIWARTRGKCRSHGRDILIRILVSRDVDQSQTAVASIKRRQQDQMTEAASLISKTDEDLTRGLARLTVKYSMTDM
jgi:hypothetical protein